MKQEPNQTDSASKSTPEAFFISVCIATYKREKLLVELLNSLVNQSLPPHIKLEVIVVDNDSDGSAEKIVQKFQGSGSYVFKYFIQPEKNISLTRNKCVENSSGKFICFIDDDETASTEWIISFYNAVSKYNADGAFGYVEPVFDNSIPEHFRKREFYFSKFGETGLESRFYFTTNAIVKADLVKNEQGPFNPSYGLTGGEDAHMFERLANKGAKFIDCREALTFEFIPSNRASLSYLYNRALRGGQSFARRKLELKDNISFRILIFLKAFIMIFKSLVLIMFGFFSVNNRIKSIQVIGASVGKLRSAFNCYKTLY